MLLAQAMRERNFVANKQEVEKGAALLINTPSPCISRERVRVRVFGK
jgi:hypothetical protein